MEPACHHTPRQPISSSVTSNTCASWTCSIEPGISEKGTVEVSGPSVRFTFEHRGQAFVRMRVSWDIDKAPIVHPLPSGATAQPQPRTLDPGRYLVSVRVHATDLPGLPNASIDSTLFFLIVS